MLERARGWVQWTAQPDPLAPITPTNSPGIRLPPYTKARTEDGAALESFNIERSPAPATTFIPNCQFEEYLHVSCPRRCFKMRRPVDSAPARPPP